MSDTPKIISKTIRLKVNNTYLVKYRLMNVTENKVRLTNELYLEKKFVSTFMINEFK